MVHVSSCALILRTSISTLMRVDVMSGRCGRIRANSANVRVTTGHTVRIIVGRYRSRTAKNLVAYTKKESVFPSAKTRITRSGTGGAAAYAKK